MRSAIAAVVLLVGLLRSVALGAPFLKYVFMGSAADRAAILTEGSLPIIGGAFGCGQFNQGAPSCTLDDPNQQCCAHDIQPVGYNLSGQTVTIYVIETRGSANFIEWQGVCRPTPTACIPGPSAPWCQNGLDYRGPREPQSAAHTCTLTLPSDGDVFVITRWEGDPDPALHACTRFQAPYGTCAAATTITTTSTTSTTSTTIPFDQLPLFKQNAARKMKTLVDQLLYPCIVANAGSVVFFYPGSLAIGPIVGATMISVATPVCARLVAQLLELKGTYDDPPDPDFRHVARVAREAAPRLSLPPCTGLARKDRALCRRLGRAVTAWVAQVNHVESVARALETTANRLGAATAANNKKAAKKQLRAAQKLTNQLNAANRARARAGAKLAAVIRSAGVTGSLTEAQSAQPIDIVLAQLASQGFDATTVQALLGSTLAPRTVDVLKVLGQQ